MLFVKIKYIYEVYGNAVKKKTLVPTFRKIFGKKYTGI